MCRIANSPDTGYPANLPYRISGRGPQPGGYRPLIYNNVVLRYFLMMLLAGNPELQQRSFAILFEDAFRGTVTRYFFSTVIGIVDTFKKCTVFGTVVTF